MTGSANAFDAIILGAGGAGLMCAAIAGQRGKRVLTIDHADKPGKKILISGGGRCNFTNIHTAPHCYISANPHFAKSALSRYTPEDFIALVDSHGVAWHEKTLGQLFCDGSAKQIVDMLLEECASGGVAHWFSASIASVTHADAGFRVETDAGLATAPALVIATGGPSIPKMGATGFAYDLARQFGLKVVEPRPALVPFTLSEDQRLFKDLSGVSAPVVVRCGKVEFEEAALFTHKGLSGPAILQISSYWRHGREIGVDFLPAVDPDALTLAKSRDPNVTLAGYLKQRLPERLAVALCRRLGEEKPLHQIADRHLADYQSQLHDWRFTPNGTEGFAKAEVTVGGISTGELSSRSMEAKIVPGLYAIGEAVDVTGWLGGYNFQWAWASGVAAGEAI